MDQENRKNGYTLFQYLKISENDLFSKMKGSDLQDFLYYLETYDLELRRNLGFNENVSIGLEIEFEYADINKISTQLKKASFLESWLLLFDGSLMNGGEIVSPILKDEIMSWKNLQKICSIIFPYAQIGWYSGGHIHIGTQVIGEKIESWLHFIQLWSAYENVIFRFLYGEFLSARPGIKVYAKPIGKLFWERYHHLSKKDGIEIKDITFLPNNNLAINFQNVKDLEKLMDRNTIEFRCPNGSFDPVIWQNNVNLLVHILEYCKNLNYDNDTIKRRSQMHLKQYFSLEFYNEVFLDQALEFCDLLFDNNLDKIYFLRQYLKSFEISNEELKRAQPFTKTFKNLSRL